VYCLGFPYYQQPSTEFSDLGTELRTLLSRFSLSLNELFRKLVKSVEKSVLKYEVFVVIIH